MRLFYRTVLIDSKKRKLHSCIRVLNEELVARQRR